MRAGKVFYNLAPPAVYRRAKELERRIRREPREWELEPLGWRATTGEGWNSAVVVREYLRKLPEVRAAVREPAPIGVPTEASMDVVPTVYQQNVALEFVYAVMLAARGKSKVSVLDWGGGIGLLSLVAQSMVPGLTLDYHVRELPAVVAGVRSAMPEVTFWGDDECLNATYDLIVLSSSFQYEIEWQGRLTQLIASAAGGYLLLTRTPVMESAKGYVVRQRAYGTDYLSWVFNRSELVTVAAESSGRLIREFLEGFSPEVHGAPARDEHRGFLFEC